MGSMIHLAVGRLEIDWGKNFGFNDHSPLFQQGDITEVPYYYVADDDDERVITEHKEGLSKPLNQVIDRIMLLGHTPAYCEKEFLYLADLNGFDPRRFTFAQLRETLATLDVTKVSPNYGEGGEDFGKFFRRELFPRLGLSKFVDDQGYVLNEASEGMENLSPYTVLHLLANNHSARDLAVTWAFSDIDEGGYAKRSAFVRPLDQPKRFLIVTEGSSDAVILKHAFNILRPHVADFFDFVDMEEGYPFSGTGNLFRFVQGLISIAVQNNVLVVFDNDAEGVAGFRRCSALNVPDNMKILKLPDLPNFTEFDTIGPGGRHGANINGCGAAIECYLHLDAKAAVRWSSYNSLIDAYQGELIAKDRYKRRFLGQRKRVAGYDYTKLESVLNLIVSTCIQMREAALEKQLTDATI